MTKTSGSSTLICCGYAVAPIGFFLCATACSGGLTGRGDDVTGDDASIPNDPPPDARPWIPVDPSCGLEGAAFCENFETPSLGGRAGDLDEGRWSLARLGTAGVSSANFGFVPTPIALCDAEPTVPHDHDSQFCTMPDGNRRWVEAFDDNGGFVYNAGRIRQAFDFAGRTGTVQWEVDAKSSGGHGWWVETWITDAPIPGPNMHDPQLVSSREAIGITFFDQGMDPLLPGTTGSGKVRVSNIVVVNDYQPQFIDFEEGDYVRTALGSLNVFQIRISQSHIEVWGSDEGTDTLRRVASANVSLGFSRGYVHLTHVHYNAAKTNEGTSYSVTSYQTYRWARPAFDGPQLPAPRGYSLPDPLTPANTNDGANDALTIGYVVSNDQVSKGVVGPGTATTLAFSGVDPSGAVAANLTFNTVGVAPGDTLRYRLNGGTWRTYQVPANLFVSWERQAFSVPVPIGDLVAGDNTVEFGTSSAPFFLPANSMYLANIDLEVQLP